MPTMWRVRRYSFENMSRYVVVSVSVGCALPFPQSTQRSGGEGGRDERMRERRRSAKGGGREE